MKNRNARELRSLGITQFAVFASGRGSNFESIHQRLQSEHSTGKIACVVSNNRSAPVLEKAREYKLPAYHKTESQFETAEQYVQNITEVLQDHDVDYILLAGYMKKIPHSLLDQFPRRFVNIHPALLPSFCGKGFYGMHVHEAVIDRGVKWTGVTVHFVDKIYDHGPIIYQYPVRVLDDDTPEILARRVLKYEHQVYPKVVGWLCRDWVEVREKRVYFTGPEEEWEL